MGQQQKALQDALEDAFTLEELRGMVRTAMNQNLDAVAGGSNLRAVVFNLVEWAQRTGRLDELIDGARDRQSGGRRPRRVCRVDGQALRDYLKNSL